MDCRRCCSSVVSSAGCCVPVSSRAARLLSKCVGLRKCISPPDRERNSGGRVRRHGRIVAREIHRRDRSSRHLIERTLLQPTRAVYRECTDECQSLPDKGKLHYLPVETIGGSEVLIALEHSAARIRYHIQCFYSGFRAEDPRFPCISHNISAGS